MELQSTLWSSTFQSVGFLPGNFGKVVACRELIGPIPFLKDQLKQCKSTCRRCRSIKLGKKLRPAKKVPKQARRFSTLTFKTAERAAKRKLNCETPPRDATPSTRRSNTPASNRPSSVKGKKPLSYLVDEYSWN